MWLAEGALDRNFCRVSYLEYIDSISTGKGTEHRVRRSLGSKQNGVVGDGDVIRVFLATDTLPYAIVGDCIPRLHRQISRCTQAVHQAATGPLRGECDILLEISNLTGTEFLRQLGKCVFFFFENTPSSPRNLDLHDHVPPLSPEERFLHWNFGTCVSNANL